MATSSQGTTLSFGAVGYTVTSISVSLGQERERIRLPHMGMAADDVEDVVYLHKTQENYPTVEIDYIGGSPPSVQAYGTISISGKFAFSGPATCVSSSVRLSVGDMVRGSASFRVAT